MGLGLDVVNASPRGTDTNTAQYMRGCEPER